MEGVLQGSVALITGGGRGFGRALAIDFAAQGAAVAVVARTGDQLEATVHEIESAGGRALAIAADVTDLHAIEDAVALTAERLGPITLLVNNAAVVTPLKRVWEADPDEWRRTLDINLIGPMICCRAVVPGMLERRGGRILNIVSLGASVSGPASGAYCSSKAALVRLTEALALETRDLGIRAFAVDPGPMDTEMLRTFQTSEELAKHSSLAMVFLRANSQSMERPVALCRRLAAGDADAYTGRLLSYQDDLDDLIARSREILAKDGYSLRRRRT